jgi:hypothetical protein
MKKVIILIPDLVFLKVTGYKLIDGRFYSPNEEKFFRGLAFELLLGSSSLHIQWKDSGTLPARLKQSEYESESSS